MHGIKLKWFRDSEEEYVFHTRSANENFQDEIRFMLWL